jgi:hypothetical protein
MLRFLPFNPKAYIQRLLDIGQVSFRPEQIVLGHEARPTMVRNGTLKVIQVVPDPNGNG